MLALIAFMVSIAGFCAATYIINEERHGRGIGGVWKAAPFWGLEIFAGVWCVFVGIYALANI